MQKKKLTKEETKSKRRRQSPVAGLIIRPKHSLDLCLGSAFMTVERLALEGKLCQNMPKVAPKVGNNGMPHRTCILGPEGCTAHPLSQPKRVESGLRAASIADPRGSASPHPGGGRPEPAAPANHPELWGLRPCAGVGNPHRRLPRMPGPRNLWASGP